MIGISTNMIVLGIIVVLALIILKKIIAILEDYAGLVVAVIGTLLLIAPAAIVANHVIIGIFLIVLGLMMFLD
ncbi:hypothetical protein TBCH5v1_0030 [Thermococcus barophilus]|uniref:Uncharacterized protein n=2 Tax=Thermococcus barophilus TaxID=55802 RepID=A0A0S1X891_THEBA|nr:hypothetical protein TBCH5v1_0030 [Thermococcus barophilus]